MVEQFGSEALNEQYDSLGREDFEQEFCAKFVDESYSFYAYEAILPNTSDDVSVAEDFSDVPRPTGRLLAGFDVGRTRDRSELALFEEQGDMLICRMLRSYQETPFAAQEADIRRMLNILPVARLSIDNSGIGMNLAENLARDFPQVVRENFTNENKERWATDFKILLQRQHVALPKDRDLVAQIHSIRKRVLPSGKVSFEGERTVRGGHADRFWAVALACQKERVAPRSNVPIIHCRIIGTREENDAAGEVIQRTPPPEKAASNPEERIWVKVDSRAFWPF
jgi:phage FluMu gp28-like protein